MLKLFLYIEGIFTCERCRSPSCFYINPIISCDICCQEGTYYNQGVCETCPSLCLGCINSEAWTKCTHNATLIHGLCTIDISNNSTLLTPQYSDQEIEQVESLSYGISTTSLYSNGNNAMRMISTIQIFVFLHLLQVEMPLILKSYIDAQVNYYPA
jgi:hypothetical protein